MDDENYRDIALRKIGKNVVNLHRIESLLKTVIALSDLQYDDLDTGIQGIITNQNRVSQFTLGGLVSDFEKKLDSGRVKDQLSKNYSFSISIESKYIQDRVIALRHIAEERNKLIHHRLSSFKENFCLILVLPPTANSGLDALAYLSISQKRF